MLFQTKKSQIRDILKIRDFENADAADDDDDDVDEDSPNIGRTIMGLILTPLSLFRSFVR